ncbi:hypothetical protein LOTGIDRAFT_160974 [Lottia gigantea]|uniref:SCAN box domain-containing protein n=1 Tax=Lottia gigantea TaxID=225164 RepID=V4AHQ9_LOTGI|nr:hypothetical protein LOTGIDRAFT_160974 [Lottia gigantea]ESO94740.1 hypothetical protein LOTGIDRAFT_160974 [Lottia gigantea]
MLKQLELKKELCSLELSQAKAKRDVLEASLNLPFHESAVDSKPCKSLIKLPPFDESIDEMDAYINRFERFAQAQGWQRLPADKKNEYEALRDSLLKSYNLTEEGFHNRFRNSKPIFKEIPQQFIARLEGYFNRWIELSQTCKNYDALKDLLLREQFLVCCSLYMTVFLKERVPKTVDELIKLTDQYLSTQASAIKSSVGERRKCVMFEALCMTNPVCDLILGNISGVKDPFSGDLLQAVETHSGKSKQNPKPLRVSDLGNENVSKEQLKEAQQIDDLLKEVREKLAKEEKDNRGGLIYRCFTSPEIENGRLFQ